ncbi:MAG: SMP-30/gluconolactonase/LRE family protein, partial [Pseudomonadota bacterium]|nr:SMP-30/gluconolactonase/LRE family protein [Pseudomonadota bacterium]
LPDSRFNDGKVDRHGRFWAGTMDDTEQASIGALYRLGADLHWNKVDDGYGVTNGPAFNRAGDIIYHTDSARRTIYRFALSPDGELGRREIFARFTGAEGYPDGMTVDAEDCLWVAFWDGWAVRRFSPAGEELAAIDMPVQRPTSVAFGGPELDRLYVTSARIGLDQAAIAVQPSAGGLFMLQPGVSGIAERPFAN